VRRASHVVSETSCCLSSRSVAHALGVAAALSRADRVGQRSSRACSRIRAIALPRETVTGTPRVVTLISICRFDAVRRTSAGRCRRSLLDRERSQNAAAIVTPVVKLRLAASLQRWAPYETLRMNCPMCGQPLEPAQAVLVSLQQPATEPPTQALQGLAALPVGWEKVR